MTGEQDVHAGLGAGQEEFLERVDGRGRLRGALLPDRVPVAGKAVQGGVGNLEHHGQARQIVGVTVLVNVVEAAHQFGLETDQGVVDVGDVATVRHAGQALGPPVGDPLEVEDQGVAAVVQELGGEGAQDGRGAAAGAGADQDVRRSGVQVDADRLSVGGQTDQDQGVGQGLKLLADARVGQAQHLGEVGRGGGVLLRHGAVFRFCAVPGEPGVLQDWGDRVG
ncbi:hypothetical protein [Streptomyces daghestanicus]|uniref:hypothetical protein n=1 Tax=Streptomyces daghestanicus TaxID=66885 RepID=UPI00167DF1C2|nr:hypothetical protein [Streptomyces daghestanicus]